MILGKDHVNRGKNHVILGKVWFYHVIRGKNIVILWKNRVIQS